MRFMITTTLLITGMLVGIGIASAHHSFAAEFDSKRPIKLQGVVTKVEWTNPHVWIYLSVKDESGKVTNWGAEMGPPHGLQGRGWRRTTLKEGDVITVEGSLAKNGTSRMNARSVTLASTGASPGARLDAASSQQEQEGK